MLLLIRTMMENSPALQSRSSPPVRCHTSFDTGCFVGQNHRMEYIRVIDENICDIFELCGLYSECQQM